MAVAQCVRHWSSDDRVVQAEGSSLGVETLIKHFFSNGFISVLLGLINFSDIVICVVGQIVVANKTVSVLIFLYYC